MSAYRLPPITEGSQGRISRSETAEDCCLLPHRLMLSNCLTQPRTTSQEVTLSIVGQAILPQLTTKTVPTDMPTDQCLLGSP